MRRARTVVPSAALPAVPLGRVECGQRGGVGGGTVLGVHRCDWRAADLWARPFVGDFSSSLHRQRFYVFVSTRRSAPRLTLLCRGRALINNRGASTPPPQRNPPPAVTHHRLTIRRVLPPRATVSPTTLYSSETGVSATPVVRSFNRARTQPSSPPLRKFVHRI